MSKLEPAPIDTIPGRRQLTPKPVIADGEEQWEIAKVLESKYIRGKLHYRFLWSGFEDDDAEQRAWQPAENAANATVAVQEFHEAHPSAAGPALSAPKHPNASAHSRRRPSILAESHPLSTRVSQGRQNSLRR